MWARYAFALFGFTLFLPNLALAGKVYALCQTESWLPKSNGKFGYVSACFLKPTARSADSFCKVTWAPAIGHKPKSGIKIFTSSFGSPSACYEEFQATFKRLRDQDDTRARPERKVAGVKTYEFQHD